MLYSKNEIEAQTDSMLSLKSNTSHIKHHMEKTHISPLLAPYKDIDDWSLS